MPGVRRARNVRRKVWLTRADKAAITREMELKIIELNALYKVCMPCQNTCKMGSDRTGRIL